MGDRKGAQTKWVFGYGSLMWKIDFPTIRKITGYVEGFERTMEWADEVHRGVPKQTSRTAAIFKHPDKKKRVYGVVYEITLDYWNRVLQPNVSYRERGGYGIETVQFKPFDAAAAAVPEEIMVTLFLGDKTNKINYKPGTVEELAKHIVKAVGASGTNLEYLYSTVESLRMILPHAELDNERHMFELETAARRLENLMKHNVEVQFADYAQDDLAEKRRTLLRKLFHAANEDFNQYVDLKELKALTNEILGLSFNDQDVKKIINEIDADKNGKLTFNEFIQYFQEKLPECYADFKRSFIIKGTPVETKGALGMGNAIHQYACLEEAGVIGDHVVSLSKTLEDNQALFVQMHDGINSEAMEVVDFFFPSEMEKAWNLWFGKSEENDKKVKERFSGLVERALAGELDHWMSTATDCLALAIILNQFTRMMYRDTPKMYSGDEKAQGVVTQALFYQYWKSLTPTQIGFLPCMPLGTSENLHFQELAQQIWNNYIQPKIKEHHPVRKIGDVLERNLKVIKQFKRYPHRNKLLGRESTPEEIKFLEDPKNRLDLGLGFDGSRTDQKGPKDNNSIGGNKDKLADLHS